MKKKKRIIRVSVLPGEPLNGSGRLCIHLFVRDERGQFVEPHVLRAAVSEDGKPIRGQMEAGPARGRLACDIRRKVAPVTNAGVTTVTMRSDDPRAVTCLKCIATKVYKEMLGRSNLTRRDIHGSSDCAPS